MTRSGLGTRGLGLAVALGAIAFAVVLAQPPAPHHRRRPSAPKRTTSASTSIRRKDDAPVTDLDAGRLRDPRERRAAEDRAVRARRHPRGRPAGHADRAEHRARVARDGAELARARCSCCSSTPTTSTSTARTAIRKPLVDALDRLIGPDDLVARDDAGDVGRATSPSRARRRRSTAS